MATRTAAEIREEEEDTGKAEDTSGAIDTNVEPLPDEAKTTPDPKDMSPSDARRWAAQQALEHNKRLLTQATAAQIAELDAKNILPEGGEDVEPRERVGGAIQGLQEGGELMPPTSLYDVGNIAGDFAQSTLRPLTPEEKEVEDIVFQERTPAVEGLPPQHSKVAVPGSEEF